MLTTEPTPGMIREWKRVYDACHTKLRPNRKTGEAVDMFFREHFPYRLLESAEFRETVTANILENGFLREKLPEGTEPDVRCYSVGDVLVGIDRNSGAFHVESEDTDAMVELHDALFAYRGLDAKDLRNFFLVAEYVRLTDYCDRE